MNQTLTICRGIPGSGKSTWAREQVRRSQGKTKRVNRDDLRAMIDDSRWSRTNEKHINFLREYVIGHYLDEGFSVVIDDTNCKTAYVKSLIEKFGRRPGLTVQVKVFDTDLAVCLVRNGGREGAAYVPEDVIRRFHVDLHGPEGLGGESGEEFDQEFVAA